MKIFLPLIGLLAMLFAGCEQQIPANFDYNHDFTDGLDGWEAGFADYPVGQEAFFQLGAELALLPEPLDQNKPAFQITGSNRSDDLLMYIQREFNGLKPNTEYAIRFQVQFASQYPENSVGIGGSPGASVYLKVGAKGLAPQTAEDGQGMIRLDNYDIGNQSTGGEDALVLGSIGIEGDGFEWTLLERDNTSIDFFASSDDQGRIWFFVGTDSGFEGTTTIYYNRVTVVMAEVQ